MTLFWKKQQPKHCLLFSCLIFDSSRPAVPAVPVLPLDHPLLDNQLANLTCTANRSRQASRSASPTWRNRGTSSSCIECSEDFLHPQIEDSFGCLWATLPVTVGDSPREIRFSDQLRPPYRPSPYALPDIALLIQLRVDLPRLLPTPGQLLHDKIQVSTAHTQTDAFARRLVVQLHVLAFQLLRFSSGLLICFPGIVDVFADGSRPDGLKTSSNNFSVTVKKPHSVRIFVVLVKKLFDEPLSSIAPLFSQSACCVC